MLKAILTFFTFLSISAAAQSSDSLVGNWKFKDLYKSETMDSTKRANLRMVFADLKLHLKAGSQYTAHFFNDEEGTWTYDDVLKQLVLTNDKGENKINVIEITPLNLALEMGRGKILVLQKILIE